MIRRRQAARNRQRRILSKPLHANFVSFQANNNDEFYATSRWRYMHLLIYGALAWYFGFRRLSTFLFISSALEWLGIINRAVSVIKRRTNFNQLIGTGNVRQRTYYYVDYWLSTFPYVGITFLFILRILLARMLLTFF